MQRFTDADVIFRARDVLVSDGYEPLDALHLLVRSALVQRVRLVDAAEAFMLGRTHLGPPSRWDPERFVVVRDMADGPGSHAGRPGRSSLPAKHPHLSYPESVPENR
jgi:hypothetical protein